MSSVTVNEISPIINSPFLKGMGYVPGIGHIVNAIVLKKLNKMDFDPNLSLINNDKVVEIRRLKSNYETIANKCNLITKVSLIVLVAAAIFASPLTLAFVFGGVLTGLIVTAVEISLVIVGIRFARQQQKNLILSS